MTIATAQAFVEATIINTDTGELMVYHPIVVDVGTKPLLNPTPITLPKNLIIGIWFGYNGIVLTLVDSQGGNILNQANCVN
jgi:hypothetical protein